jgi:hypothetical protein
VTAIPKLPRLDPAILADDASLAEAIDGLTRDDRRMQQHAREIRHRQRELQDIAEEEAWSRYLHVEEAVNARLVELLSRVARWGFDQGREFECRERLR